MGLLTLGFEETPSKFSSGVKVYAKEDNYLYMMTSTGVELKLAKASESNQLLPSGDIGSIQINKDNLSFSSFGNWDGTSFDIGSGKFIGDGSELTGLDFVPYEGANRDVDLGENQIRALQFISPLAFTAPFYPSFALTGTSLLLDKTDTQNALLTSNGSQSYLGLIYDGKNINLAVDSTQAYLSLNDGVNIGLYRSDGADVDGNIFAKEFTANDGVYNSVGDQKHKRNDVTKLTHADTLTTIHQALDVQGSATVDSLTTDVGGVTSATNYKLTNLTYNELVKYMYEARPTIVGSGSEDTTIFTSIGTGANQVNFKLIRNNGGYFDRNLYVEQNQTIGGSQYITGTSRVSGVTNYGSRTTEPTSPTYTLVAGDKYYLSVGSIGWYTYSGSAWVKDSTNLDLALKANIASPTFTGTVTAPTINVALISALSTNINVGTFRLTGDNISYDGAQFNVPMLVSASSAIATSFIKSGGTYSQMLMADGSVQKFAYAGIYVDDGATAQAIATGATYTKLTGFALDQISRNATSDVANDQIVITELGDYDVGYSISYQSGTPNVTFEVGVFGGLTGALTEQKQIHTDRKLSSSDTGSASGCGLLRVTAVPYYIDLRASHDSVSSVNITMVSSSLIAKKIGV